MENFQRVAMITGAASGMVVVVVYCLNPNKSTFKSMIAN